MPEFTYEALAGSGQRSQGTLTATSEREVLAMLDARGLFPVKIGALKSPDAAGKGWGRKIKSRHMASFYSQLADLLRSGVSLLKALDILERQGSQPALSEVLREVRAKVADGTGLSEAMAMHPRAFDELAVSMVKAGQEAGFLEDVLTRIADFTEHQEDLKAKVVGAMAYPVFLAVTGFIVLNVLVVFFVPRFEPIFKKLDEKGELPLLTQGLIGTSHLIQRQGLLVLAGAIGLFWLFRRWARTESGRLKLDAFRLRLPGMGTIYVSYALSRFTRILGTLLHNGIPILQSLNIAKDSTGNRVLTLAIEKSAENIKGGESLAAPLGACKQFPRDIVEMIAVGEESNSLETVLIHIADGLEKRTGRQLDLFVRLLEPVMLLVMAAVTLLVVSGLLLPIFKMSSAVE
ncbi:MAG: type II secretion system F family protein [Gemmataceae bacterium]